MEKKYNNQAAGNAAVKWAVQKWNGELPQYMGSGSVPFINIK